MTARPARGAAVAYAFAGLWCAAGLGAVKGAGDVGIAASGGPQAAWLVRSTVRTPADRAPAAGQDVVNVFAWRAADAPAFAAATIPPQVSPIARMAVAGSALHVFYADGTHHAILADARRIERDLPRGAVPAAVTGITRGDRAGLLAIVSRDVARAVRQQAAIEAAATRPAATRPQPATRKAPEISARTGGRRPDVSSPRRLSPAPVESDLVPPDPVSNAPWHLVAYNRGRWQYTGPVDGPPAEIGPDRLWLCALPDAVCVLWADQDVGTGASSVRAIRCLDGETHWSSAGSFDLGGLLVLGAAVCIEARPAFAAAVRETSDPAGATWRVWRWEEQRWEAGAAFAFGPDPAAAPDPKLGRAAVAAFGEDILIAAVRPDGGIDVGVWSAVGGAAKQPFARTKVFEPPRTPLIDPQTRQWIGLAVVVGSLLLVYRRRQSSLTTAAALPPGMALAGYGRRLGAAVLDLLPALALTAWLWYEPLAAYVAEIARGGQWRGGAVPAAPAALVWAWVAVRAIGVVYGILFERMWGATPGKWLLGCAVVGEDGGMPSLRQIVVRNAIRFLEMEVYVQIWPLLWAMFFTRNRQRFGDLIARTIVVEPGASRGEPGTDGQG